MTIATIHTIMMKQVEGNKKRNEQRNEQLASHGVLAQLGEHLPYKQRVIGSSPIGPIQNKIWRNSSVG